MSCLKRQTCSLRFKILISRRNELRTNRERLAINRVCMREILSIRLWSANSYCRKRSQAAGVHLEKAIQ